MGGCSDHGASRALKKKKGGKGRKENIRIPCSSKRDVAGLTESLSQTLSQNL